MTHGVFINYKRSHKYLAGRIYDFLKTKGLNPFMDEHALSAVHGWRKQLKDAIDNAPYFLCLLTVDGLKQLESMSAWNEKCLEECNDIYYKEINEALQIHKHAANRIIIILFDGAIPDKTKLPDSIKTLVDSPAFKLDDNNQTFFSNLECFYNQYIDESFVKPYLDWKDYALKKMNTSMFPRHVIERELLLPEMVYGKEFVDCIMKHKAYEGDNRIESISMACYTASILFDSTQESIDVNVRDGGVLSQIMKFLLTDPEFSLKLVTVAPDTLAVTDAVKNDKLGNSSVYFSEKEAFLNSYLRITELVETEPFLSAKKTNRFQFYLTDCVLPYAIFNVQYKNRWKEYDYVKVDLYSFDIESNSKRRSMVFFRNDQKDNYDFFVNQLAILTNQEHRKRSKALIDRGHDKWITSRKEY